MRHNEWSEMLLLMGKMTKMTGREKFVEQVMGKKLK